MGQLRSQGLFGKRPWERGWIWDACLPCVSRSCYFQAPVGDLLHTQATLNCMRRRVLVLANSQSKCRYEYKLLYKVSAPVNSGVSKSSSLWKPGGRGIKLGILLFAQQMTESLDWIFLCGLNDRDIQWSLLLIVFCLTMKILRSSSLFSFGDCQSSNVWKLNFPRPSTVEKVVPRYQPSRLQRSVGFYVPVSNNWIEIYSWSFLAP